MIDLVVRNLNSIYEVLGSNPIIYINKEKSYFKSIVWIVSIINKN